MAAAFGRATLRHSLGIDRSGPVETVELLFDPEVAGYVEGTSGILPSGSAPPMTDDLLLNMNVAVNPSSKPKSIAGIQTSK